MSVRFREGELFLHAESITNESVGEGVGRKILGFDSDLMMARVTFTKGSVGPIHHHPHRQVTYVESGAFEVFIGKDKRVLKTGDCFFVPPHIDHGVVALEDGSLVDVFAPARADFLQVKDE
jgi:quercetin dioxygenase-like cupin family protein